MVVWIGKDCWNKIMSFKKDIEEAELLKQRLAHVHLEMFFGKVDNIEAYKKQRKRYDYYKQNITWDKLPSITLFFSKDYIVEQINKTRSGDNWMMRMIRNHRHFKIRIILIDDVEDDMRIPISFRHNLPNIDRMVWRSMVRRLVYDNEDFYLMAIGGV